MDHPIATYAQQKGRKRRGKKGKKGKERKKRKGERKDSYSRIPIAKP